MADRSFKAFHVAHTPFLAAMLKKMGFEDFLNEAIEWDTRRCSLSPGKCISALVINTLTSNRPLYKVNEFYAHHDTELLFGKGVDASKFTDDVLGRALDKLARTDMVALFGQLSMVVNQSIYGHNRIVDAHIDRTSVSLYGDYEGNPEQQDEINIVRGRSKDYRPDLKQFTAGMMVNSDGFPFLADISHGNLAENPWFAGIIEQFKTVYAEADLSEFTVIADAAFASDANLTAMKNGNEKLRFITRLPATFKAEKEVRQRALGEHGSWQALGHISDRKDAAEYRSYEGTVNIDGVTLRSIVYGSSSLDKRKEKSLQRQWQQKYDEINAACGAAEESFYNCRKDAAKAAERVVRQHGQGVWQLSYEIADLKGSVSFFEPEKKGKKKRQTVPNADGHTIRLRFLAPRMDEEKARTEREVASQFVIVTTIPEHEADSAMILKRYKEQYTVETGFKFLKGPCLISPIHLKNKKRIAAMGMVIVMAYMLAMSIQIRVRRGVTKRNRKLDAGYRKTDAPTFSVIVSMLEGAMVVIAGGERYVQLNLHNDYQDVLSDCGLDDTIWHLIPE